jgi:1,4-alpha-glucan branching enzyme
MHVRSRVTFVYDNDGRRDLSNPRLVGSWNPEQALPMEAAGDGRWQASVELEAGQKGHWSVRADGPAGPQQPALFGDEPAAFETRPGEQTVTYAPRRLEQNGVYPEGEDARFRLWAPRARQVELLIWDQPRTTAPRTLFLSPDPKATGMAWRPASGASYGFAVTTTEGRRQVRTDPYARRLKGQLRGVGDLYLHAQTGREVNKFQAGATRFTRFEVQQGARADSVSYAFLPSIGAP